MRRFSESKDREVERKGVELDRMMCCLEWEIENQKEAKLVQENDPI